MNKIVIYIYIFGLFWLILNHFILLITKEGLENQCVTKLQNGCKVIAIEKNTQSGAYTKTLMKNAKKSLLNLMNNVSKLITVGISKTKINSKNIATNTKHTNKLNAAMTPDKK